MEWATIGIIVGGTVGGVIVVNWVKSWWNGNFRKSDKKESGS